MLKAPRNDPRTVVFIAMILAIFMVSVEATIVATALPTIVADLGGLRYFSWVFGAYLLTQVVTIPIYGRLADFFGRKALLITAIVIFLAGSILSGFAHSMFALILFRALQGVGAGGVQPVSSTIVGDIYQGRERARAQGYLSSAWAFSAVVAPLLGAFLIAHYGWPIIFWVNLPIGIACIAVVTAVYHEEVKHVSHRIDYAGSALLALGVGTLMFVLVMAGNLAGATAVALSAVAVIALAALVYHELRTPEPMMPLYLYRIRVIAVANAGNFFVGAMVMGATAFIPTFVQGAMGYSAIIAGSVLCALFITWTIGSIGGAQMQLFFSYRTVALIGTIPVLIGSAMLVLFGVGSNIALAYVGLAIIGVGFGTINSVFIVTTQSAVEWELRGAATSSNVFLRQIGQAMGAAGFAAIFNLGVYSRIPDAGNVVSALVDPIRRAQIAPADLARDVDAIAASMHGVNVIIFVLALAITVLVMALPGNLRAVRAAQPQGAQSG